MTEEGKNGGTPVTKSTKVEANEANKGRKCFLATTATTNTKSTTSSAFSKDEGVGTSIVEQPSQHRWPLNMYDMKYEIVEREQVEQHERNRSVKLRLKKLESKTKKSLSKVDVDLV